MTIPQFAKFVDPATKEEKIGVVVRDQYNGGVYRGHCNVWFGETKDGKPVIKLVLASNLKEIPEDDIPLGG